MPASSSLISDLDGSDSITVFRQPVRFLPLTRQNADRDASCQDGEGTPHSLAQRQSPHIRYRERGFDSGLVLYLQVKLRLMAGSGLSCDVSRWLVSRSETRDSYRLENTK